MNLQKLQKSILTQLLVTGLLFTNLVSAQDSVLHEGTPIRLKLNRTISSGTEHEGDKVDFEVLDDIKANEAVVIPHGSTALATVTEAVAKGRMGKGGKLNVNIDFVRLPNGDKLPLRGVQEGKGGTHTGAMTGAMIGTAIVFWPAAPLFLFMHGKDITVPQGHEVTVYTNTDYNFASSPVAPHSNDGVTGRAMTNTDVLALRKAGLSEELVIAKIKSAPGDYQLEPNDMIQLKTAGLSDGVMAAMIAAKH